MPGKAFHTPQLISCEECQYVMSIVRVLEDKTKHLTNWKKYSDHFLKKYKNNIEKKSESPALKYICAVKCEECPVILGFLSKSTEYFELMGQKRTFVIPLTI